MLPLLIDEGKTTPGRNMARLPPTKVKPRYGKALRVV